MYMYSAVYCVCGELEVYQKHYDFEPLVGSRTWCFVCYSDSEGAVDSDIEDAIMAQIYFQDSRPKKTLGNEL